MSIRRLYLLRIGFVLVCGLLVSLAAVAKCPAKFIIVRGEVQGEIAEDAAVELRISPKPKYKTSPVRVVEGRFEIKAQFDSFKSLGWLGGHNCSRKPESVVVVLIVGGREYDRVTLNVPRDFEGTNDGDFTVHSPVTLNAKRQ